MTPQTGLLCQIIPVETGNLLIPECLVAETITLEEVDSQKDISWKNRTVPIVSNSNFNKLTTRVSIIKTVMGYKEIPFIAIPTDGIPHTVSINPTTLIDVSEVKKDCTIAASYGRVGSLDCIIVDLPKIENAMVKELRSL